MIYLIRHAETVWNADGRFQGKTDTPLSENGRKQAYVMAERMKNVKIERVYSSPLMRARDTAAPLAEQKGLSIIEKEELTEIDFGHWEGLTVDQIMKQFPDEFENCGRDPYTYGFRYGLEFDCVKRSVNDFLQECSNALDDENIAVIAHSVILKMILLISLGLPPGFLRALHLENCSISIIGRKRNNKVIYKLNDTGEIF